MTVSQVPAVEHGDYLTPGSNGCEQVELADIAVGDVLWVRSPDGFDAWYRAVHVDTVQPSTGGVWLEVREVGGNGRLTVDTKWGTRRHLYPSDRAYRCRTVVAAVAA